MTEAAAKKPMPPEERAARKVEKAALAQAEKERRELEGKQLDEKFNETKEQAWDHLYALALQLWILNNEDQLEDNRWWFEDFQVSVIPGKEWFKVSEYSDLELSFSTINRSNYENIESALKHGFDMREREIEDRMAAERERQRLALVREAALAKLNPEEKKVLGIK